MNFGLYGENVIHKDGILSMAVYGNLLATSSEDDTIALCRLPILEAMSQIKAHNCDVKKILFSADGASLITSSANGEIKIFDTKTLSPIKSIEGHSGQISDMVLLKSGELLSVSDDSTAKLWDIKKASLIKTIKPGIGDIKACASINGKIIIGGSHLVFLDNSLSTLKKSEDYIYGINRARINGNMLFISTSMEKTLEIWDIETMSLLKRVRNSSWINDICFYKDKTILAMGEYLKTLNKDFEAESELEAHKDEIYALAIYEDFLISGSNDKSMKIWKIKEK